MATDDGDFTEYKVYVLVFEMIARVIELIGCLSSYSV